MGHDVFISYSTQDKLTADAVCGILESQGLRCWIAPRDIALGSDWTESLVSAIELCPVMVLVFSKHANESHQIKREVNLAIENGRTVIPVRVEDVMPSKSLKFSININHWLDAFPPPLDNHLRLLAESIRGHLEKEKLAAQSGSTVAGVVEPVLDLRSELASALVGAPVTPAQEDVPKLEPPHRAPSTQGAAPAEVETVPQSARLSASALPPPAVKSPETPREKILPELPKTSHPPVPPILPGTAASPTRSAPRNLLLVGFGWVCAFVLGACIIDLLLAGLSGLTGASFFFGFIIMLSLPAAIAAAIWMTVKGKLPGTRR